MDLNGEAEEISENSLGKSDGKRITVATTLAKKFPNISLYLAKEVLFLGTPENDVPFVPGLRNFRKFQSENGDSKAYYL